MTLLQNIAAIAVIGFIIGMLLHRSFG